MTVLTCEKCQTQFKIPADKLGTGRKVRCTSCGHIWFQRPLDDGGAPNETGQADGADFKSAMEDAAEMQAEQENAEHAPVPEGIKPQPGRPDIEGDNQNTGENQRLAVPAGVLVFTVLLFVTLVVLFAARQAVIGIWPSSAGFYNAIGLYENDDAAALRFTDGQAEMRTTSDGRDMLYVTAQIINEGPHEITLPPVEIALYADNENTEPLNIWTPAMEHVVLAPQESHTVKLGFTALAENGKRVKIYFQDSQAGRKR